MNAAQSIVPNEFHVAGAVLVCTRDKRHGMSRRNLESARPSIECALITRQTMGRAREIVDVFGAIGGDGD
jgi:hypothetical protein